MTQQNQGELTVYVGTYTTGESKGIYVYRMNTSTGALSHHSTATGVDNPTFLAIDPKRRWLYAAEEIQEFEGESSGSISAFSIDQSTGGLSFLNRQATHGPGPCHLNVDATGKFVLVANYHGGSIATFPIQPDGGIGEACEFIQHEGSSVDPNRQEGPHAHSINLDAANRIAIVADLGMDKVLSYRLDINSGKLALNDAPPVNAKPGAGPRHFAFHPNGNYGYLINELGSTMTAFAYDASRGTLTELQTLPTLPEDFTGTSHCADVHVHPSGKFLYGSNRGHDSIVIYEIDEGTGKMTFVGHQSTQGSTPRNFAIDPTGAFLLAANQNSSTVVTFRIDPQAGTLTPTGDMIEVPNPVCLLLTPAFA